MPKHLGDLAESTSARTGSEGCLLTVLVALMVLVIGAAFAVIVPAGAGLDEPMHVARVEQIAEGGLLPQEVPIDELDLSLVGPSSDRYRAYGGQTDSALYKVLVLGNKSYQGVVDRAPYAFPTWEDERLALDDRMGKDAVTWLFSNTAINSPVSYAPYVVAFWTSTLVTSSPVAVMLAMRLTGVVVLAAATFGCMRLLPVGRRLFAFIVLLPCSLTVNSMVTADLMTFVCASVYFSCLVRMLWNNRAGKLEWGLLWVSLFCLCLGKLTYAAFGLLLFILPMVSSVWRTRESLLRIGVVGFTSLAAFVGWYLIVHDINTGFMWSGDIDPEVQAAFISSNPLAFLVILAKSALITDVLVLSPATHLCALATSPWPIAVALVIILASEFFDGAGFRVRRGNALAFSGMVLFVCITVCVLVFLALYLQFSAPGAAQVSGVQSRYFLPVLLPLYFGLIALCRGCLSTGKGEALIRCEAGAGERSSLGSDVLVAVTLTLMTTMTFASLVYTVY